MTLATRSERELKRIRSIDVERPVLERFLDSIQPDSVVYDIGANVGIFSAFASQAIGPSGSVVSFEPEPSNAAAIRHNISLNDHPGRWEVAEKAVSDSKGRAKLAISGDGVGEGEHTLSDSGSVTVETVPLSELAVPDVVKIDVEGSELDVLNSAKGVLGEIDDVFVEVHPDRLDNGGDDVQRALSDAGFELEIIHRKGGEYHIHAR